MRCFLDDLRAFGINADQWMTAAQDEGKWRRTAEQGAERFIAKWIAAEKAGAGLRHSVVYLCDGKDQGEDPPTFTRLWNRPSFRCSFPHPKVMECPTWENKYPGTVVVVFLTLTDRASTIPSNIRGCQSGTWSQRGTKVNESHHGDNPLLRPTGIQIATKSYATLQAMAPTNNKTVPQTSFTLYREQPRSTRILSPTHDQRSQQQIGQIRSNQFYQQFQVSQGHTSYKNKENLNTEVHGGGGLELVKPAREPASSRPKPCASLKKPHKSCPFAAPCGPLRKKNDRGQKSAFPSETSRFALLILAHRGSALPWLVNDRAALRLRRIWCVPT